MSQLKHPRCLVFSNVTHADQIPLQCSRQSEECLMRGSPCCHGHGVWRGSSILKHCFHIQRVGMSAEVMYAGEAGLIDDAMKESLVGLRSRTILESGYACESSALPMEGLHY